MSMRYEWCSMQYVCLVGTLDNTRVYVDSSAIKSYIDIHI